MTNANGWFEKRITQILIFMALGLLGGTAHYRTSDRFTATDAKEFRQILRRIERTVTAIEVKVERNERELEKKLEAGYYSKELADQIKDLDSKIDELLKGTSHEHQ